MSRPRTKRLAAALATAVAGTGLLAGCGSGSGSGSGAPALTWYINPDGGGSDPNGGGQAELARICTEQAKGAYSITTQLLPNSASSQREQLLRRLAASDSGVDIMSLDPVFVAEFAEAGYLAPVPKDMEATFTEDRVKAAVDASRWKDKLVAVPFWANTQLLWYRKSVAKAAGLDMSKPVTWDQLIAAAKKENKTIGVQAMRYEGYTVWINALIAGAGGKILDNPGAPAADMKLGLASPAGEKAAQIINAVATSGVGGPAIGSSDETVALNLFSADSTSGFLVNWPYVWAALPANGVGFIDDIGWARYPRTVPDVPSRPPFGGIELGVNAASQHADAAYKAVECITTKENQQLYMLGTGNPASRQAVFDAPAVRKAFPMANLIRTSLDEAAPRPQSQFYGDLSTGLQRTFSPPSSVNPSTTPEQAAQLIKAAANGEVLL